MCRDVPLGASQALGSRFSTLISSKNTYFPPISNYFNPSCSSSFGDDVRNTRFSYTFPDNYDVPARCSRCIKSVSQSNSRCIFLLPGSSPSARLQTRWSEVDWCWCVDAAWSRFRQLVTGPLSASGVHLVSRTCDGGVRLDHKKIFPRTANSSHHPTNGNGARG